MPPVLVLIVLTGAAIPALFLAFALLRRAKTARVLEKKASSLKPHTKKARVLEKKAAAQQDMAKDPRFHDLYHMLGLTMSYAFMREPGMILSFEPSTSMIHDHSAENIPSRYVPKHHVLPITERLALHLFPDLTERALFWTTPAPQSIPLKPMTAHNRLAWAAVERVLRDPTLAR